MDEQEQTHQTQIPRPFIPNVTKFSVKYLSGVAVFIGALAVIGFHGWQFFAAIGGFVSIVTWLYLIALEGNRRLTIKMQGFHERRSEKLYAEEEARLNKKAAKREGKAEDADQ